MGKFADEITWSTAQHERANGEQRPEIPPAGFQLPEPVWLRDKIAVWLMTEDYNDQLLIQSDTGKRQAVNAVLDYLVFEVGQEIRKTAAAKMDEHLRTATHRVAVQQPTKNRRNPNATKTSKTTTRNRNKAR